MTLTNLQYIGREQLQSVVQALLYLNLGSSYSAAIDITEWLEGIAIDVSEGIVDTSGNTSGQLIDKIELLLDNTRGEFDEAGRFFGSGIVNNSKIKITCQYTEATLSGGVIFPGTACPAYAFNGIIKADSSAWDIAGGKRIFHAGVLQAANILASEIINPGYCRNGRSLEETLYLILRQPSISRVVNLNVAYINPGFDIAGCVNNAAELVGKNALEVINQIGVLSGSKWYIDSNGYFVMEPINNTGASVWDITDNDTVSIDDLGFDPLQFNAVTWDDGALAKQSVRMSYATRQAYNYDCFEKTFDIKYITGTANRLAFLNNYLALSQYQHRMITLTVKSNPDLLINQIITINHPLQFAGTPTDFVWGVSSWGDGSEWGVTIPGLVISPATKWRVLSITRKLNLAPDMIIVAVQAGAGPDSAL